MKPSVRKRQERLDNKKRRRILQNRNTNTNTVHYFPQQIQQTPSSFAFKSGTILTQPHTWLIHRLFKMPLKQRLAQFAHYEMEVKKVFPSFCEAIFKEYMVEMRLRYQFRRLANAWIRRQMDRKSSDLIDPITLNPIVHPIYVYDRRQKRRYVFEAESLNKAIKKNLYAQQYTVPHPKRPINILTNKSFMYVQLISVYDQLLSTRCRMEDFSLYRKWGFRLETWKHHMYNHIYVTAIKEELYNYQSADGQDMLEDFIKDMMSVCNIPLTHLFETTLTNAVAWYPDHSLLQQLRSLCVTSYEANIFHLNTGVLIAARFDNLFRPNHPKCPLWDMVMDRMKADSDAEAAVEAADSAATAATLVHLFVDEDDDVIMQE
jgi:hypothetical protein